MTEIRFTNIDDNNFQGIVFAQPQLMIQHPPNFSNLPMPGRQLNHPAINGGFLNVQHPMNQQNMNNHIQPKMPCRIN